MNEPLTTETSKPDFAAFHEAQRALCKSQGWPHFAPRVCWECRKEIYSHPNAQSAAGMTLITDCPHCHKSYCD